MIPDEYQDLLLDKNIAHVSTKNPDGTLQISPVWIDYDEKSGNVLFNTARGRKKDRNLSVGSPIAISITDSDNFYRYLTVQGEIIEKTTEGAVDHINKLAKKYLDRDEYGVKDDETRIKLIVKPIHVNVSG